MEINSSEVTSSVEIIEQAQNARRRAEELRMSQLREELQALRYDTARNDLALVRAAEELKRRTIQERRHATTMSTLIRRVSHMTKRGDTRCARLKEQIRSVKEEIRVLECEEARRSILNFNSSTANQEEQSPMERLNNISD